MFSMQSYLEHFEKDYKLAGLGVEVAVPDGVAISTYLVVTTRSMTKEGEVT